MAKEAQEEQQALQQQVINKQKQEALEQRKQKILQMREQIGVGNYTTRATSEKGIVASITGDTLG